LPIGCARSPEWSDRDRPALGLPNCFLERRRSDGPLPCAIHLRAQRPDHMAVAKSVLTSPLVITSSEEASDLGAIRKAAGATPLQPASACYPFATQPDSWVALNARNANEIWIIDHFPRRNYVYPRKQTSELGREMSALAVFWLTPA
jgi:hypothetical protein